MLINQENKKLVPILLEFLNQNGVVILKCDTIYGIIGIADVTETRISKIKNRNPEKPFIKLIGDISWLKRFTNQNLPDELKSIWPGPLTVIFKTKEDGKIGLRVPDDPLLQEILDKLDKPLVSTSVNLEGQKPLNLIIEIIKQFEQKVDLIVKSGDLKEQNPSTIIDVTTSPYKIIRKGILQIPQDILKKWF